MRVARLAGARLVRPQIVWCLRKRRMALARFVVLKLIVVAIGAVAAAVITFDGGQLLLDVLILALLAD
jgi:hypothetical protein